MAGRCFRVDRDQQSRPVANLKLPNKFLIDVHRLKIFDVVSSIILLQANDFLKKKVFFTLTVFFLIY